MATEIKGWDFYWRPDKHPSEYGPKAWAHWKHPSGYEIGEVDAGKYMAVDPKGDGLRDEWGYLEFRRSPEIVARFIRRYYISGIRQNQHEQHQ